MAQNIKDIKDGELSFTTIRRCERLTSALYRVTALFLDEEPLKWKLREIAIELLSSISRLSGVSTLEKETIAKNAKISLSQISSLLETSIIGGVASEMNLSILKDEYILLRNLLSNDDESILNILENNEKIEKANHLSLKDNFEVSRTQLKGHQKISLTQSNKSQSKTNQERRNIIVTFIKERGESSIKDIIDIPSLTGKSNKTIQRELISLVDEGILKKRGERRWSRYFI